MARDDEPATNGRGGEGTTWIGDVMRRLVDVRAGEVRVLLLSCAYFLCVLFSYYIIRPIRDNMGAESGIENLAWLFSGTLGAMLLAQPLFAWLVARFPRRALISFSYRFFALNLVLFFVGLRYLSPEGQLMVGRVFFIWTSVFNMFAVSIFWSLMADVFSREQGKRLFGLVAIGGTVGAIAGSAVTTSLSQVIGPVVLLIVSAALLELAVQCTHAIQRSPVARDDEYTTVAEKDVPPEQAIGGSVWAGFTHVARSPYFLGVVAYMLLYTVLSTFLYFQQQEISLAYFADRASRTSFFAAVDLAVNVLTLGIQLFLTGRIMKYLGVGVALALLPIASIIGFAGLAMMPVIWVFVVFHVLRRAGNFAVARPSREVLFTIVPREDKYKAKNFIDTVVYRAGDQVGSWSYTLLSSVLGLGMAAISWVAVPLAVVWSMIALWLGRRQARIVEERRRAGTAVPQPVQAAS